MDYVTQSLIAIVLARAGLNRIAPRAALLLVAGCNLPSLLLPVIAVQGGQILRNAVVFLVGVAAHYALRMLHQGDIIVAGSPWLIGALSLALLAPLLSNLVSSEMGVKRRPAGRGWATLGAAFTIAWIGGNAVLHQRAIESLNARTYSGSPPVRTAAWPTQWNPLVWRGYVATESFWMIGTIPLHREFDPEAGCKVFKPEDAQAVSRAMATAKGQSFLRAAKYPIWRITPPLVEATDAKSASKDQCPPFTPIFAIDAASEPNH